MSRKYGWKKQVEDVRDHQYADSKYFKVMELPHEADLRAADAPIYDQGELGSCTGNGIARIIQYIQKALFPSRLFIYYNERALEGTVDEDAGANIRDGIKSVATIGVCSESICPYDISQFTVKPSDEAYAAAQKDIVTEYLALKSLEDIKNCLAQGFPVVFGTEVFESFEGPEASGSGEIHMPAAGEQVLGGHCMVIVGFDDTKSQVIVANSWGTSWGASGYCFIPYAYIEKYASDFWTIRKDTGENS